MASIIGLQPPTTETENRLLPSPVIMQSQQEQAVLPVESADDDLDDDDEVVDDRDLEIMQERVIVEFRSGQIDLTTPSGIDVFKNKYGACLAGDADCATIIHKFISSVRRRPWWVRELKPLLELVLVLHPFILEVRDQQGETALHFAIRRGFDALVEFLCSASRNAKDAISCRGPDGGNCVHAVLFRGLHVRYFLVKVCHPSALAACDVHGRTPLHLAVNYSIRVLDDVLMVRYMIDKCPEALSVKNSSGMSPYQAFVEAQGEELFAGRGPAHGNAICEPSSQLWKECAAEVQQLLVEACMRHLNRADCIEALYGTSEGLAIEFDLEGIASLPGDSPLRTFDFLQFESVLRLVAIPPLTFASNSIKKPLMEAAGQGRDDFLVVFNWLRSKGVKRILRVLAVDHQDRPHTDEAIEAALVGFDVEEWDWRKPDICSQSILAAAPNVRVLNLYSTGSNAVLRDWSSSDGLTMLKKLERIQVIISKSLESPQRTRANLEEFSRRLLRPRVGPQIELFYSITNDMNVPGASLARQSGPERKRDWLGAFKALLGFTMRCAEIGRKGQIKPVKIALIADGIDATEEWLSGKLLAGRTFTVGRDASDRMLAYYVSSHGHGTFLGRLVCKLFPMASFIVGKIQGTYIEESGELHMNADMVAQATAWAIHMRADIIVYGGLPVLDQEHKTDRETAQKRLETTIAEAKHKHITVLRPVTSSSAGSVRRFPSDSTSYRESGVGIRNGSITDQTHTSGAGFAIPGSSLRTEAEFNSVEDSVSSNGRAALALAATLAATVVAMARTLGPGVDPRLYDVEEAFTHLEKEMDRFLELPHTIRQFEKTPSSEMLSRLAELGKTLFGWDFFEAPEPETLEPRNPASESDSSLYSGSTESNDEK